MTEYNIVYNYHSNREVCNTIPVVTHVSLISQNNKLSLCHSGKPALTALKVSNARN